MSFKQAWGTGFKTHAKPCKNHSNIYNQLLQTLQQKLRQDSSSEGWNPSQACHL